MPGECYGNAAGMMGNDGGMKRECCGIAGENAVGMVVEW